MLAEAIFQKVLNALRRVQVNSEKIEGSVRYSRVPWDSIEQTLEGSDRLWHPRGPAKVQEGLVVAC